MKKAIIIILAVLLAIDIGVIAYGATRGPSVTFDGTAVGLYEKPEKSVYNNAETWNDLSDMLAITDKAQMAATLLMNTTYNLIESTGFYVSYNTDIVATSGESSRSENFRVIQAVGEDSANELYQTLTSSSGFEKRQVKYYYEELKQQDFAATYDEATGKFDIKLNDGKSTPKTFSKKGKTTYVMRSWFDFPLYLGGKDGDDPGDLVWDSIDASTVEVNEEKDYYTITFALAEDKTNEYENAYHYLSYGSLGGDQTGGGSVNHINSMTVVMTVWKCGLFRDIVVTSEMNGKLGGKTGDATVTKTYIFSYAEQDASVAYWLCSLEWFIFLENEEGIAKYEEEIAAFQE